MNSQTIHINEIKDKDKNRGNCSRKKENVSEEHFVIGSVTKEFVYCLCHSVRYKTQQPAEEVDRDSAGGEWEWGVVVFKSNWSSKMRVKEQNEKSF